MTLELLTPVPPGEILLEEFMKPMGISINALSRDVMLRVPPDCISEIVSGKRSIIADTALRFRNIWSIPRNLARPAKRLRYPRGTARHLAGN